MAKTQDALAAEQNPKRKGLRVQRHFTTEGVHPYDQLTWELRDAVITNWRDGTIAFEQRGVEFPATWSLNATNIVAQKYFRGPLGSPKRERSVRQMIDRVAGTIADWGIKDKYFASRADGESFRAELTHILVNQIAAFNSPVWFNVGVEENPQSSACQPYDALVSTPTGMIRIGDLITRDAVGTVVYDAHGETRVRAVTANGDKRVFKVRLRNGSFIEATGDHLVYAVAERRTQGDWYRVDQLQPGMRLHLYPHRASQDDVVGKLSDDVSMAREAGGGTTTLARPATTTRVESEAALAGWLQADGFVGQDDHGTNRSLTVEFMTVTQEEYDWVQQHLGVVFPDVHQHVREFQTADPQLQGRRIRLNGAALRPFVASWGLLARRHDLRVPARLWDAPNDVVAAYLRSVFQAEGSVSVRGDGSGIHGTSKVALAVIGERWTEDLQLLLLRLGIYSRRLRKTEKRADRSDLFELSIGQRSERFTFAAEIGFLSKSKRRKLSAALSLDGTFCPDLREEEIVWIEDRGVQPVYDIQTDSGEYLSNNIRVHNCFILAVEDNLPSILNWYTEEGLIFKGGSGSGINLSSIRSSKELLSSGGQASGPVSFMRGADASAGTVKSGGKCYREGTLVATPRGMRPIERLRIGDMVLTHKGPRAVADFMRNGRKQCYRVVTREGYEVEVTAGHKFAYWNAVDGGFDVKPIEEFKPGDALYALLEPSTGGTTIPLPPPVLPPEIVPPVKGTSIKAMTFPSELDERLAYVLGLIYGDGDVRTEYPYRVQVVFAKDPAGLASAQRFRDYCKHLFGEEPLLLGDDGGCQRLGYTRQRLVEFLVANGIAKGKGDALGFPSTLFRAMPGVRAAFIAGVIDADGSYQRRGGWSVSSIDRPFLVDLQRLLLTLGVPAKIKLNREQRGAWRPLYRLHVVGHTFVQRLVDHITSHSAKAQITYEPSPGADKGWGYRPSLLQPLASRVTRRGGYRLIERTVGMNETSGYRAVATLARHPQAPVAAYAQEVSTCVQLTLEAVTPTEVAETYDIEVEDAHLLSANGIYASNTRRAAKMIILNVDHPDVRDFIWCKAREEHKARVLREAGFDMDLDGPDSISIQYQNANNSVRVNDDFMRAYDNDQDFDLKAVLDNSTVETTSARGLMREIAQAAWECADPGVQYDTTINDWHTLPESGRITASNPCFTGDTLVHTDRGLIRFDELLRRAGEGERFGIYTHDATNPDTPAERVTLSSHDAVMVTGTNPIVRLRFSHGAEVRCTPNHRFWTANRGWVEAEDLGPNDKVRVLDQQTPASMADKRLPVSTDASDYYDKHSHVNAAAIALPEKWTPDFAHFLGWIVGDGSFAKNVVATVYGSAEDRETVLPRHRKVLTELMSGFEPKIVEMGNGTVQLRSTRQSLARFFEALGLKRVRAGERDVPWSIMQAPPEIQAAFLRGLFDADGTVVNQAANQTRYVGLGSRSNTLLRSVQALLSSSGISSRIYANAKAGRSTFTYSTRDGIERAYESAAGYDLRVTAQDIDRFATLIGFDLPGKAVRLQQVAAAGRYRKAREVTLVSREDDGFETTYNLSEPRNHSYVVNGMIVSNCSEYLSVDNSACNLASLNLLKFLRDDSSFDVEGFKHAVEVVFTAQEILVGNSSYPTKKIDKNTKAFRQLGLGYANLGALLMARGKGYDSDGGRAWAGAITALMTGHAYRTSARIAEVTGPFDGYPKNRKAMLRVMGKHRAAVDGIDADLVQPDLLAAARESWDGAVELGKEFGYRNAQASVLAPTGCLVPETLVTTDRGLMRLGVLGDQDGADWQDLDLTVSTDEGPRQATKFYVNGHENTRRIETDGGYLVQGTLKHRLRVVDEVTGEWVWKRMVDVRTGDLVPIQLGQLVGAPRPVMLPTLGDAYWTADRDLHVPSHVTPELAELVGYFMGDGSLHAKGIRLCVADTDPDLVDYFRILGKELFGIEAKITQCQGYTEVNLSSVRLALWWEAAGFAKSRPSAAHRGKGWEPHIPDALLETNNPKVYGAFLRGLFEADGSVTTNTPTLSTASAQLATDVSTVMLALGIPATTRRTTSGWGQKTMSQIRVRNIDFIPRFNEIVGFISRRKASGCADVVSKQSGNRDRIALPRATWEALVPAGHPKRNAVFLAYRRYGAVSRTVATQLYEETGDPRLAHALGYVFERVSTNSDGGIRPTFDLSVPDNVTYVANGFVSHNTISFLMDCDTTGIEPDLALIKYKKLVGGGSMAIVNHTVPRALRTLGYPEEHVQAIVDYVAEHNTVVGAPALREEHHEVFQCAMGDQPIHYMGHLKMMAAAQPFVSGSISKTVNMPEHVTVEDVEQVYLEGWKLGLKAVAIYRDNCKVAQPLSATKSEKDTVHADTGAEIQIEQGPVRRRLPKTRPSTTTSFQVGDIEGYLTTGSYPDDGLGEIFVKVSKQGSTLSGVMDAFAIAVSIGLQYGVPLETYVSKFTNMIFEPNGLTDDNDVRMAQSIVDYVFRRLAIDHLDAETRQALGVRTTAERTAALNGQAVVTAPAPAPAQAEVDVVQPAQLAAPRATGPQLTAGMAADAPYCSTCGVRMRPAGSCYVCESCGTTSGCS